MENMDKQSVRLAGSILLVSAIAFVVFSPVLMHDFLRYDDEIYVYENPHIRSLNIENIKWVFTHSYFKSYTPVSLISHSIDYAVFGFNPSGHHLTNLLLHAINTGWVFLLALAVFVIARHRGNVRNLLHHVASGTDTPVLVGAALASLVFALHPLRVESVAWVSDRKDLLMGWFLLPALLCYLQFATVRGESGAWKWIVTSGFLFVLAVLSKTISIVFPVALLGADLLLLQDVKQWKQRILPSLREKIPLFLLSVVFAFVSVIAAGEEQTPLAVQGLGTLEKLLLPLYSPAFYFFKFLWPATLMPVYLAPELHRIILYALVTIAAGVVSIHLARAGKTGLLLSSGFFVLFLLPTILGQSAGIQPWADRYTYIPSIGLSLLIGWSGIMFWPRPQLVVAGALVIVGGFTALSLHQIPKWEDSITLWKHAVQSSDQRSVLTMVPLGVSYFHAGEIDSAIACYTRILQVQPESPYALYNLGVAYAKAGNIEQATHAYERVISVDSSYYPAANNLANVYLEHGAYDKAIGMYRGMIRRGYYNADVYYNLGVALEAVGDEPEAIAMYEATLKMVPGHSAAQVNLGALAMKRGRVAEAAEMYRMGLSFDRTNPVLHYNLAVALESSGDSAGAITSYTQAIQLKKDYLDAYVNLGNLYAQAGLIENASLVFQQAIQVGLDSAEVYFGYGVVSEALGNMAEAIEAYNRAIERDSSHLNSWINLGSLYARTGRLESAERTLAGALDAGLESPELVSNLTIIRNARKNQRK